MAASSTPDSKKLEILRDLPGYQAHFMDISLWEGYVHHAIRTSFAYKARQIRPGVAGSYPTFIVNEKWVIKFFGELLNGAESHAAERSATRIANLARVPCATLVAEGKLFDHGQDWPWPYLIFDFIPGLPYNQVQAGLTHSERIQTAQWLGENIARLHQFALPENAEFPNNWKGYLDFLNKQRIECIDRHRQWGVFPPHLCSQMDDYILPAEQLISPDEKPHLIHADITRDHLLGEYIHGVWACKAIIDFGDAISGSLFYELCALHLDLFAGDRELLRSFLQSYGTQAQIEPPFIQRAMSTALLHRFNVFEILPNYYPAYQQATSLDELADCLWQIDPFES